MRDRRSGCVSASTRIRDQFAARRRASTDGGFTLIEAAIALSLVGVLIATCTVVIATLYRTTSRVTTTYDNVDQQLWLATNLQRLVRSAVAPAPSFTTQVPVPAFSYGSTRPTPTSMTFYTNTGTSRGPEKVTASCTVTPSDATLCRKTPAATFTVTITSPSSPTTCPFIDSASHTTCTWPAANTRTLVNISDVTNGVNGQPLFVYAWQTPLAATGAITTVCVDGQPAGCSGTDAVFTRCTAASSNAATFHTCLSGEIQSVTYDLQINAKTSALNGGEQAEDDTGIFALSSTSQLYDPTVG
jgi:type II secretory pathway pseudopilin PulG